jgi:threonine synthase
MNGLGQSGGFTIEEKALARIREEFDGGRASSDEAANTIAETLSASGYLLDPHTASAVHVARQRKGSSAPMIVLATAHPAKFPAAVEAACGRVPGLPDWLADLMDREQRFTVLPSDRKMVEDHVANRARAVT